MMPKNAMIVEQAHIHQPKNRELDLRGQQPEAVQAEHEPEGQRDLQNHLLRLGQAEVAMPDDLNEVIQKADEPEPNARNSTSIPACSCGIPSTSGSLGLYMTQTMPVWPECPE